MGRARRMAEDFPKRKESHAGRIFREGHGLSIGMSADGAQSSVLMAQSLGDQWGGPAERTARGPPGGTLMLRALTFG